MTNTCRVKLGKLPLSSSESREIHALPLLQDVFSPFSLGHVKKKKAANLKENKRFVSKFYDSLPSIKVIENY